MPDRTLKDKFRRLKVRVQEGFKDPRAGSDRLDASLNNSGQPSGQTIPGSQQVATENVQQGDRTEVTAVSETAASSHPLSTTIENDTPPLEGNTVDTTDWDNIWVEAYKKVKEDPQEARLLAKLELFLEKGGDTTGILDGDEDSAAVNSQARLKAVQKIAKEKLDTFEEGKLSFNIGDRPIIVRESILKAVDVINTFKPIVTGAVELNQLLRWLGLEMSDNIRPRMLERVFQQDENAATGVTEITFLMARYQMFQEPGFASDLQSMSYSEASNELLHHVREELVGIHADIYLYEARFILQYATGKKMHRAFRNALNSDDWKKLLSEIQSKARRIDDGVRGQIGGKTLEMWKKVKAVETTTERIESLQQDTMKAVLDVDRRQLLQSLKVTGNAIFDSRQTSSMEVPCLPGTQLKVLKTIQDWAEGPTGPMIFWLEGMAGTGKTSVSMTVASASKDGTPFTPQLHSPQKVFLGASFFFNQGDGTRNDSVELFTTIAWCLSGIFLDNGSPIIEAIRDNPEVETKSPQQQFRKLIADPLALLDKNTFIPFQLLVVIDALDECDDKDAEILLGMLENLANLSQVRLRLFITSRREAHITRSFEDLPSQLYQRCRLEKVETSHDEGNDITYYLSKTLGDITTRYRPHDGGVSKADVTRLAHKADGLFIYAVTACRFLDGPHFVNKKFRDIRLALIFEDQEGPQQEVDGIYLKVLKFPDFDSSHESFRLPFYSDMSRLIGFIIVLLRPVSVDTLCYLLPSTRLDVDYLLGYLHPIINVPDDPKASVTLIHLSFRDFILDEKRSEPLPFSINELAMHQEIVLRCLEIMNSELRRNICDLELPGTLASEIETSHIETRIPQYLRYACLHWVKHLNKMDGDALAQGVLKDDGVIHVFLQKKLLFWLEVLAFIGEAPSMIPIMIQLESLIEPLGNTPLLSLVRDARIFIRGNRWIIEHAPMQIYCSTLLFCPDQSKIRFHYEHLIPHWITTKPNTQESEQVEVSTLYGHTDGIFDVSFSPTEALLASVSRDDTTRVWDYITGSELYRFQDPERCSSVCFSMDGLKLASLCPGGLIYIRNLKKATDVILSCPDWVQQISFSPTDSNILAASCSDGILRIWDIDDQEQGPAEHAWQQHRAAGFAFSPDGQTIAVYAKSWIAVFDVIQGKTVCDFQVSSEVSGIAFSIDSRILAIRQDETVEFWDVISSDQNLIKSYRAEGTSRAFLNLPTNENFNLHQSPSGTTELFETSTGRLIGTFQREFGRISHDGALSADLVSERSVIRIFSNSVAPSLDQEMDTAPDNVKFLEDDLALSYDDKKVSKIWNFVNGDSEPFLDFVRAVTISPDRTFILLQFNEGDEFQVWSEGLRYPQATFREMADVAFAPRTGPLVTLSLKGELETLEWDAESRRFKPIWGSRLEGVLFDTVPDTEDGEIRALYLSLSGQEAIVNYPIDGTLTCQLWGLAKREKVNEIILPHVCDIIFSPTNEFFAIECNESTKLFYTSNGDEIEGCDLDDCISLKWHPVRLAFAVRREFDNKIAIWEGLPWTNRLQLEVAQDLRLHYLTLSTTKVAAWSFSESITGSNIDIWDITTGQNICSQAFSFLGYMGSFNLSAQENFLESNRGRMSLPIEHTTTDSSYHQWEGLYILDEWVSQGHERLLWLPTEYRPANGRREMDVRGGMVALTHKNNSVVFIGFKLDSTPVAERFRRLNREKL